MTRIQNVMHTLTDLADFLNENCEIHNFLIKSGAKTQTIYKVNGWYVTVKRDTENLAYAVEIRLKVETNLSDLVI